MTHEASSSEELPLSQRGAVGCLLGGASGLIAAVALGLLMSDDNLSAYELGFILALAAVPGGAVAGALLALVLGAFSQRGVASSQRGVVVWAIAIPLVGGTIGGALFFFGGGWISAPEDQTIGETLAQAFSASAGGALLGLAFGSLALPLSIPLALAMILKGRK